MRYQNLFYCGPNFVNDPAQKDLGTYDYFVCAEKRPCQRA